MKKKELYEAPEVETYELVNEKFVCTSFDSKHGTETFSNDGDEDLGSSKGGLL